MLMGYFWVPLLTNFMFPPKDVLAPKSTPFWFVTKGDVTGVYREWDTHDIDKYNVKDFKPSTRYTMRLNVNNAEIFCKTCACDIAISFVRKNSEVHYEDYCSNHVFNQCLNRIDMDQ